jgi:DNA repair protein RecN (Recombination protein N)
MLSHLRIENFAIIDRLELEFQPGLVILTGETGAGKSIILDAIVALLGGQFDATSIRAGAGKARIEATFDIEGCPAELAALLAREELLDNEFSVAIEREIRLEGRTSARINGHSVNLGILREAGDLLVDIHGQSEHLSLMNNRQHIGLLDRYANDEETLKSYQKHYHHLQDIRRELKELRVIEQEAASRTELLSFQDMEITSAQLESGEDILLEQERNRLANAENLALSTQQAISLLDEPAPEMPSITDLLGQLNHELQSLARFDPSHQDFADQGSNLLELGEDLSREIRNYADQIEFNPHRLQEIEERLGLINNLKRKYGGSIESILEYQVSTREKLEKINSSGERIAELVNQEKDLLEDLENMAQTISAVRKEAASRLSEAIETELGELKMEGARFQVAFELLHVSSESSGRAAEHPALDGNGMDRVEFLIAPNPGEGLKPLVKIASGGETSRLMLALKNVLAHEDRIPSLVFDEIDQGIGGRVGSIVGKKLRQLAGSHQVFCVTHLPQLAAYGTQHYHVEKDVTDGRTITRVQVLDGNDRVVELAQMLGNSTENTMRSAEELLQQVSLFKSD